MKKIIVKFFDSIINDEEPLVTLEDGLQALEVANEIIDIIENPEK